VISGSAQIEELGEIRAATDRDHAIAGMQHGLLRRFPLQHEATGLACGFQTLPVGAVISVTSAIPHLAHPLRENLPFPARSAPRIRVADEIDHYGACQQQYRIHVIRDLDALGVGPRKPALADRCRESLMDRVLLSMQAL